VDNQAAGSLYGDKAHPLRIDRIVDEAGIRRQLMLDFGRGKSRISAVSLPAHHQCDGRIHSSVITIPDVIAPTMS
jgi:hypothetical protein